MEAKNLDEILIGSIIPSSVYQIPITQAVEGGEPIYIYTQNVEITGTGTLTQDVLIELATSPTPKEGWSVTINWRANMTPDGFKLSIQGEDYTELLTGAASQDFHIIYLNGAWEVSNLDTTITGRLSPYALISNIAGYISDALDTFIGSAAITTLGTIVSGVWHGTAIGDTYIASASNWNGKAPLASPAFTDVPTAPTAALGTSTTQLATTQFVQGSINNYQLVAWGATIDLTGLVGATKNTVVIDSITANTVIDADVFAGDVSEIDFILPFAGAFTVTAGTNMSFAMITGVSTHRTVLTVIWDAASNTYIQKSFSQN